MLRRESEAGGGARSSLEEMLSTTCVYRYGW